LSLAIDPQDRRIARFAIEEGDSCLIPRQSDETPSKETEYCYSRPRLPFFRFLSV